MFNTIMATAKQFIRRLALGLITTYRLLLSPWLKPCCRFYPTCSSYTHQAITQYGFLRGGWLGLCRLVKCHPWHEGGVDPVPLKAEKL